jgi:hypothetical protein
VLKSAIRSVAIGASAIAACGVMATAATAAPSAGSGKVINVHETSSALTGIPKTIAAGQYTVTFKGPQSSHGTFFQFIRLSKGYSEQKMLGDLQADFTGKSTQAQRARLYSKAFFAGGSSMPTDKYSAYLAPGSYVVGDFINGKFQTLTVTKGSGPATPPAGGTIKAVTMQDGMLQFAVSGAIPHGQALKFVNTTDQPHFISLAKLEKGGTLKGCLTAGKGCEPGYASGAISKGESEVISASALGLTAGHYLVACFIPDVKTGVPHAMMGMYKEITVK